MYFATKPPKRCTVSATHFWYAEMTSRKSSGSIRAERAVEPTKSENITVTWRRSAASCGRAITAPVTGLGTTASVDLRPAIARRILRRSPRTTPRLSGLDRSGQEGRRNQCGFRQNAGRTRTCRAFRANLQFAASAAPADLALSVLDRQGKNLPHAQGKALYSPEHYARPRDP